MFVEVPTVEAEQPVINAACGRSRCWFSVCSLPRPPPAGATWWCRSERSRPGPGGSATVSLGHRSAIKTGDELESLAGQFNRTAAALQESSIPTSKEGGTDGGVERSASISRQRPPRCCASSRSRADRRAAGVTAVVARRAASRCRRAMIVPATATNSRWRRTGSMPALLRTRIPLDRSSTTRRGSAGRTDHSVPDVAALDPAEHGLTIELARRTNVRAMLAGADAARGHRRRVRVVARRSGVHAAPDRAA